MLFLRQWWNYLFPKPKTVNDPEFGILTLDWMHSIEVPPKPPRGLWIGKTEFAPLGRSVTVAFVIESELGSTPFQRKLYHSVEDHWNVFRDELAQQLLQLIHEWYGEAARTKKPSTEDFFQKWVRLNGVDIRDSSTREPQSAEAILDFSVLPDALTNPSLLKFQDHNPVAHVDDDKVVGVAMM